MHIKLMFITYSLFSVHSNISEKKKGPWIKNTSLIKNSNPHLTKQSCHRLSICKKCIIRTMKWSAVKQDTLHRSKKRTVQTGACIATGSDECQPTSKRRDKDLQKIERNSSKSGFHRYVTQGQRATVLGKPWLQCHVFPPQTSKRRGLPWRYSG